MSTYRSRGWEPRTSRPRSWWMSLPRRVRVALATLTFVGLFIAASWGDGPYEQPQPTVRCEARQENPATWWGCQRNL